MNEDRIFKHVLSSSIYANTYKLLKKGGNNMKTKKRKMNMYQYGSTVGAAHFPTFKISGSDQKHMLPRPVVNSRPGNFGHTMLNKHLWLNYLAKEVEYHTFEFLKNDDTLKSAQILSECNKCKFIVPH